MIFNWKLEVDMGTGKVANLPLRCFHPLSQLLSQLRFEIHIFNYYRGTSGSWYGNDNIMPANVIYFVTGGDGQIDNDSQTVKLIPGNAYLMPVNTLVNHSCETKIEKYWMMFSLDIFPAVDILQNLGEFRNLGKFNLGKHSEIMERTVRRSIADYIFLESAVMQLLSRLDMPWEEILNRKVYREKIYRKIFNYIQERLHTVIRIEELAENLDLTPAHLSRMFKNDMGQTLKSFINRKKFQRACALLSGTSMKVKEIARETGFEDEYYFMRFFSKHCGASPTQYRRRKFPFKG